MTAEAQDELALRLPQFAVPLRVISTSAQSLEPLVASGRFRGDLAGLLATLTICLPPLAERPRDLPLLAQMSSKIPTSWEPSRSRVLRPRRSTRWPTTPGRATSTS